jgi:hypothetical protein
VLLSRIFRHILTLRLVTFVLSYPAKSELPSNWLPNWGSPSDMPGLIVSER